MSKLQHFNLSEYDKTIREVLDSGGIFRIYPSGTSMLPLLREGQDSVVLSKPNGRLKQGDIAFYQRENGAYILHRVIKVCDSSYTMCGDNQTALEDGIADSSVIGYVSEFYRGERRIPLSHLGYRSYMFIWRSFLLRKLYFKLRNIFGRKG